MRRRWKTLAPAAAVLFVACGRTWLPDSGTPGQEAGAPDAPEQVEAPAPTEAAVLDAPFDARDAPPRAPHDEDGDGVLDAVDNCPNVPNADQAQADGAGNVGDACRVIKHGVRPWAATEIRSYFDSFTSIAPSWGPLGPPGDPTLALGSDQDTLHADTQVGLYWRVAIDPGPPLGPADDAVVVTAVIRWDWSNPSYVTLGVLANVGPGSAPAMLSCGVEAFGGGEQGVGVNSNRADNLGGPGDGATWGTPSLSPIPSRVGVRIIVPLRPSLEIECQLFDPAHPETLTDPAFTAYALWGAGTFLDGWLAPASSRVGLFSRGAVMDVESIDVVRLSD